ncbi:hypothetical protein V6N11_009600 [Hibiscus sabdariffa]|uniref:Uncharacterized protein n=1 Tax=Hibiscus sabdariffa TaxID=183260 RepID=A0ABR2P5X5_9ROSI
MARATRGFRPWVLESFLISLDVDLLALKVMMSADWASNLGLGGLVKLLAMADVNWRRRRRKRIASPWREEEDKATIFSLFFLGIDGKVKKNRKFVFVEKENS